MLPKHRHSCFLTIRDPPFHAQPTQYPNSTQHLSYLISRNWVYLPHWCLQCTVYYINNCWVNLHLLFTKMPFHYAHISFAIHLLTHLWEQKTFCQKHPWVIHRAGQVKYIVQPVGWILTDEVLFLPVCFYPYFSWLFLPKWWTTRIEKWHVISTASWGSKFFNTSAFFFAKTTIFHFEEGAPGAF